MSNRFTASNQIRLAVNQAKDFLSRPGHSADLKAILQDMIDLMENFERITAQQDAIQVEGNISAKKLAAANTEIAELKNKLNKTQESFKGSLKSLVVESTKELHRIEHIAESVNQPELLQAVAGLKHNLKTFVESLG